MKKFLITPFISLAFYPLIGYAFEESGQLSKTRRFFESLQELVDILIPLVFALALLVFFWGIVKYIWSSGNGKDEGKKIMIWGVIALFVMSSIWGIVAFIGNTFGIEEKTEITIPTIDINLGGPENI